MIPRAEQARPLRRDGAGPLVIPRAGRLVRSSAPRARVTRHLVCVTALLACIVSDARDGWAATPAPASATPAPGPAPLALPRAAESLDARLDPGLAQPGPRIRIGLTGDDEKLRVGADAPFRLLDGRTGRELWPDRAPGPVLVVPEGGHASAGPRVYRLQVGAFRDAAAARARADALAAALSAPADIVKDPDRGVLRVRLGRATKPEDLGDLLARVRAAGVPDAFLMSEAAPLPTPDPEAPPAPAPGLRLLDARWESRPAGTDRVVVVPLGGDARVTLEGKPYRGLLEVLRTAAGGVLAVNELPLEDYLRGVVPEELGPKAFPEVEALAAQAIAARTYALANLGQFAADGYDLCDSPRCQVYGGTKNEHPLSDRAVAQTAGQVLAYEGAPINAMFTSTCGGHTEDIATVFPEMKPAPYLRGVPCRPDDEELRQRIMAVKGREATDPGATRVPRAPGDPDTLQLFKLIALGYAPHTAWSAEWRARPTDGLAYSPEAPFGGLMKLLLESGVLPFSTCPDHGTVPIPPFTRTDLWRALADALGQSSEDRAAHGGPVAAGDESIVLTPTERARVAPDDQRLLGLLLATGVVRSDGAPDPRGVPVQGETLGCVARAAQLLGRLDLPEATVVGAGEKGLRLSVRGANGSPSSTREFAFAPLGPDLVVEAGGAWRRVDGLELLPGDRVLYRVDDGGRLTSVGLRERSSSADDRGSPRFRWEFVRDRAAIESKLASIAPVGTLRDLAVKRRGRSGRVAEIEVHGTAGDAVLRGFQVSRALDLYETLVDVTPEYSPPRDAGEIVRVRFSGRGWGHGVGMCQWGAFGMAQRGKDAREILAHYYPGTALVTLPGTPERTP